MIVIVFQETRLNLTGNSQNTSTQHVSFSGSSSAQRGTKRRRVQEASGDEYDFTHISRRVRIQCWVLP